MLADSVCEEATSLLSEYIKIDTSNPPGNEEAGAVFLKSIIEKENIPAQIYISAPGRANLVARLKSAGWPAVGFHICGQTTPIIEDVITTGADFLDVDHQVPASAAIAIAENRIALRGSLDPSALFRFGDPGSIRAETAALRQTARSAHWILSSGCDIPPGTPAENIAAFAEACIP